MARRLTDVRTHVLAGPDPFRHRVIRQLLERRPHGEVWAVLDNSGERLLQNHGVHVLNMGKDCMCCAGSVTLRVTLTRLLRQTRPQRLFILPPMEARLAEVLRVLADPWLAAVLNVRASIALACAGHWCTAKPDVRELTLATLQQAAIAAIDLGEEAEAAADLQQALSGMAAPRRVVHLQAAQLPMDLLDEPAVPARPHFATGY